MNSHQDFNQQKVAEENSGKVQLAQLLQISLVQYLAHQDLLVNADLTYKLSLNKKSIDGNPNSIVIFLTNWSLSEPKEEETRWIKATTT